MADSCGCWYDRHKRQFVHIRDHAQDALAAPKRYRIVEALAQLRIKKSRPIDGIIDREEIILITARAGFIRVRLVPGYLGWQFYGDPAESVKVLKRFAGRYELGETTEVVFTDFAGIHACNQPCTIEGLWNAGTFTSNQKIEDLIDLWPNRDVEPHQAL